MEWIKPLLGTTVGLDTAPLIYFVEEHPAYLPLLDPLFAAIAQGEIQAVTSALTLTEVLVHPIRRLDFVLTQRYSSILLRAAHLRTLPVSHEIATDAANLRATHKLRTPDAIQLATARNAKASVLLSNDRGIRAPSGIRLILLDDLLSSQHL